MLLNTLLSFLGSELLGISFLMSYEICLAVVAQLLLMVEFTLAGTASHLKLLVY